MNELILKYREENVGKDGSIFAAENDTIILRTLIDTMQEESYFNFFTWVKERIQTVNHNVVSIDKVVVVGQFKCKEKQKF